MSVSLKAKIAEVFDEPGCDKNQGKSEKERKKGCTKQLSPGAAAGGCAFDGAKIALQPVVDVQGKARAARSWHRSCVAALSRIRRRSPRCPPA